jgi:hypothetical protein
MPDKIWHNFNITFLVPDRQVLVQEVVDLVEEDQAEVGQEEVDKDQVHL